MSDRPIGLLRAAFGPTEQAITSFAEWAMRFDPSAELDPGDFTVLPAVYTARLRSIESVGASAGSLGDGMACGSDVALTRVRGIAKRAWTRNQLRLTALDRVVVALGNVQIEVCIAPGPLTTIVELGDSSAEAHVVELLVDKANAPIAAAAILAIGATSEHDPSHVLAGRVDWVPGFAANFDGTPIHLNWTDGQPVANHRTIGIGRSKVNTLNMAERIAFDLQRALHGGHPSARAAAMVDLFASTFTIEGGGSLDRESAFEIGRRCVAAQRADETLALLDELSAASTPQTGETFRLIADGMKRAGAVAIREPPLRVVQSLPHRAHGLLVEYRADAVRRNAPRSIRDLHRYLGRRWDAHGYASLIGAATARTRSRP